MNLKKVIRNIIIFLLIILVIGIVYLLLPSSQVKSKLNYLNDESKFNEGTITVGNVYELYSIYKGDINSVILDKSVDFFAKELIPEYYKIENIDSYYNQNYELIEMYIGITSKEEFSELVNKIKTLNNDFNIEYCNIEEKSSKNLIDGTTAVLSIQYENNEKIFVTIKFKNSIENDSTTIIYSPVVKNEEMYDTSNTSLDIDTTSNSENHTGRVTN